MNGMGAVPVAKFLVELNRERSGLDSGLGQELPLPSAPVQANSTQAVEDAYAQGFKDGRLKATAEFDADMALQRKKFQEEMGAARAAWAAEQGATLAEKIDDGLRNLEETVSVSAARVLQPMLMEAARRRAVAELVETIKLLLSKDEGVTLHISGPEDLLEMVRNGLYGKTVAVVYSPNEECDVRVAAGKTFMETCLGAWAARLKEAAEP